MAFLRRRRADERTGTPCDVLVVGLGNPGADYAGTRHNLGAEVVEVLAARRGERLRSSRERALSAELRLGDRRVAVASPQTYMNESGGSVQLLVRRHGITEAGQVVVVHDELDLPTGRIKVKVGGGLAGHNGLKSVAGHLHTRDFVRVRIGVGRPPGTMSGADYVLRRPGKAERRELDLAVERAADAVEAIVADGPDAAMARFNAAG